LRPMTREKHSPHMIRRCGGTKPHILATPPATLAAWLEKAGEPAYRLGQVLHWVYREYATTFNEMTNLPASLRERLAETLACGGLVLRERCTSPAGTTEKFLFELHDGEQIESVVMVEADRASFCISTQAGCALGCAFCATGAMGFARDLTAPEILGQVLFLSRARGRPHTIVFMGMGEPLLNLDALIFTLEALTDPSRFGLGLRHITVSTAGITPGILRLAAAPVRPNLALSLNSPFHDQRSELMPVNRKYPLAEVLKACDEYARASGRRLMLEYVLISGVNTSPDAARALASIARQYRALVNLIVFNPVAESPYRSPSPDEVQRFRAALKARGAKVTQRFRRGQEIAAGCGQLRGRHASTRAAGAPAEGNR